MNLDELGEVLNTVVNLDAASTSNGFDRDLSIVFQWVCEQLKAEQEQPRERV